MPVRDGMHHVERANQAPNIVLLVGSDHDDYCISASQQIAQAVQRAVLLAKREKVTFPLNKAYSLPHRIDGYWGAAKVMLRPAADGAGVIAGKCLIPTSSPKSAP